MENIKDIDIKRLEVNKGQVEGLPKNPRFIRDERFKALVKSIEDAPEMLKLRELLVVEHGSKFVVIGGNMRLRACKELGMETVPCKVLPADTPVAKLREYAIKDNNGFGEDDWDVLANEWDAEELQEWGMELPMDWDVEGDNNNDDYKKSATEMLSGLEYDPLYYQPTKKPALKLEDCINYDKFNAKVKALDEYDLPEEMKQTLKMFAYRFLKIDFEAVANYYYFNATEEEQKAIERMRLVLTDNGLNGFIEDDMLRLAEEHKGLTKFG